MTGDRQDLAALTGAIVHELRTPLTVIAGEVDLALARERSPAAYREALSRIAERVAEMVDLTRDFAFFGDLAEAPGTAARTSSLAEVSAALADRYGPRRGSLLIVEIGDPARRVAGDAVLVTGALALLVEHAARHRRSETPLRLGAPRRKEDPVMAATIVLELDAMPGGFSPATWQYLAPPAPGRAPADRELRLHAAARLIERCGGSLTVSSREGGECVVIGLRAASQAGGSR